MILKPVSDIDVFCALAEPQVGVFASKRWLSIYGSDLKAIGIYKDEHQLIGGFYYFDTKKYGFSFVKLPPYSPHCGLFFYTESKNQASLASFRKEIMTEVCHYFMSQKSTLTVLAFPFFHTDLQPFIWSNFKVIPNYTYRIDLRQSLESIKANFDPKNRNVINKALKQDISITENTLNKTELLTFLEITCIQLMLIFTTYN